LTDKYWIHGGGLVNVFKSVKYGWPEKGMKSWQAEMSSLEMAQVSAYVASLQGSNPANAKEAQGEIWSEGGAEIAVDSAVGE
jgi:cytochrome c oxidase cbb3-type subunit 3